MLSRLSWDLQLAMLRRSGQLAPHTDAWPASPLDVSFEEIALVARGTVEATVSKGRIENDLRREWDAFHRSLCEAAEMGAPHVLDLLEANRSLVVDRLEAGVFWEESDMRREHDALCQALVSPGVELVGRLLEVLESAIGEVETQALLLGRLVEHGVHPPDVYRLTYEEPVDFDDPIINLEQPTRGSWWLATRRPSPGEIAPDWKWFRGVRDRWQELGLDGPLPQEFRDLAGGGVYRGSTQDFSALIASVAQAAMAGLARLDRRDPSSIELRTPDSRYEDGTAIEPGYLGLRLDKGTRIAGREGYDQTVDLAAKALLWAILSKLANYGTNICKTNELMGCWREAGRNDEPSPGAISQAISDLRSQLQQRLGLTIKNKRSEGYKIQEISEN